MAPGVSRGYESPIVEDAVRTTLQTSGFLARRQINGMPLSLDSIFLRHYMTDLRRRVGERAVITNTHPGKIAEALRYARTIPGARFVFLRRSRDDLLLRIFMRSYRDGNTYAYDLAWIDEYLNWYDNLTELYGKALPGISRVMTYEEIVENPHGAQKLVAELCGVGLAGASVPDLGDDRGVAEPYREYLADALSAG